MKFLSLKVKNYRGIEAAQFPIDPQGITLIYGRNEVGKSSIGEAIWNLFKYQDSSKHQDILSVKPVHSDEGSEIELCAESGKYQFVYTKRFHNRTSTTLQITSPTPQNYSGREAHDKALEILNETLDLSLWRALTLQQGESIGLPKLSGQNSLSAALDRAAGGQTSNLEEQTLFDAVKARYLKFYTDTGKERKDLKESHDAVQEAEQKVVDYQNSLANLEKDIERAADLQDELRSISVQHERLANDLLKYDEAYHEITELELEVGKLTLSLDSTRKSESAAIRDVDTRKSLITDLEEASKAYSSELEKSTLLEPSLIRAEQELKITQDKLAVLNDERKRIENLTALLREDTEYYTNLQRKIQLEENRQNILEVRQNALHAEKVLATNRMDANAMKTVTQAASNLEVCMAQQEAAVPGLLLHGLADCQVSVNSEALMLKAGEKIPISVSQLTVLNIPGLLNIEITTGTSIEEILRKVEQAKEDLAKACKSAGIADPSELLPAFDAHSLATQSIALKAKVEKENLKDLTFDGLEQQIVHLTELTSSYIKKRIPSPLLCEDADAVKRELAGITEHLQKIIIEVETAQKMNESARQVRDNAYTKHRESVVLLEQLQTTLKLKERNLQTARDTTSDEALQAVLLDARADVKKIEDTLASSVAALEAKAPDTVKILVSTTKGSILTIDKRKVECSNESIEVQTRLQIQGEEGLQEKYDAAISTQMHLEQQDKALLRQAEAVKCLFTLMSEERDNSRKAYIRPLKEKVQFLGRLVFGNTFQVEINEDLEVVNRTLDGRTVPFASLSGGTKEQISLIFRSACCMIVAQDGGTPLIIDDALGFTDSDRLKLIGAVLAQTALECQILIFTCMPERFNNIGEVKRYPLH